MVITRISKLLTSGKITVCIAVQRFFLLDKLDKRDPNRYSTCLRIGYETIDRGPFEGAVGQKISVSCYHWPEQLYVFNNVPISNRLDPLFDANLTKLGAIKKYGPPGVTTLAYNAHLFTVKWGRESIMWGLLPEWFWYLPTKFCKWAVVPHLKWIGCNIHIPLSVMSFLRWGLVRCVTNRFI